MGVDVERLKKKIVETNLTQEILAKSIGIHRTTFYRKCESGGEEFTISEMNGMIKELRLNVNEVYEIFLLF